MGLSLIVYDDDDDNKCINVLQLKLRTLQSWVQDLGEQNAMLIQTVEQLEHEASERVALLKEGLDRSARSALNFMNKLDEQAIGQKVFSILNFTHLCRLPRNIERLERIESRHLAFIS